MVLSGRNRNLRDYIEALQGERRKILMFSRELPLCLELITQAIEIQRQEMAGDEYSVELPVLEEFIPLKPISSSSWSEKSHKVAGDDSKPDWLRSVRLWAQPPAAAIETLAGEISNLRKPVAKIGGAFHLFEKEKSCRPPASEAHESSTIPKQRRCWSPELHRKFLNALEQLGGSQSATPKQIRELMKVERLTNDEVKSHLQKYRLHTKQSSTAIQGSSCISLQTPPQFVFVRGIWVPPPDYVESSSAFNGTYSSVQSVALDSGLPQSKQKKQQNQLNSLPQSRSPQSYGDDSNLAGHESATTSQTTTLPPL